MVIILCFEYVCVFEFKRTLIYAFYSLIRHDVTSNLQYNKSSIASQLPVAAHGESHGTSEGILGKVLTISFYFSIELITRKEEDEH